MDSLGDRVKLQYLRKNEQHHHTQMESEIKQSSNAAKVAGSNLN